MAEESYTFSQARVRLDEIVSQVRKKDLSLEASLDLLEEGVRLANQCTELIDHADWEAAGASRGDSGPESDEAEELEASVSAGEPAAEAEVTATAAEATEPDALPEAG